MVSNRVIYTQNLRIGSDPISFTITWTMAGSNRQLLSSEV